MMNTQSKKRKLRAALGNPCKKSKKETGEEQGNYEIQGIRVYDESSLNTNVYVRNLVKIYDVDNDTDSDEEMVQIAQNMLSKKLLRYVNKMHIIS